MEKSLEDAKKGITLFDQSMEPITGKKKEGWQHRFFHFQEEVVMRYDTGLLVGSIPNSVMQMVRPIQIEIKPPSKPFD